VHHDGRNFFLASAS
jgi:RHS repeat-associated protein